MRGTGRRVVEGSLAPPTTTTATTTTLPPPTHTHTPLGFASGVQDYRRGQTPPLGLLKDSLCRFTAFPGQFANDALHARIDSHDDLQLVLCPLPLSRLSAVQPLVFLPFASQASVSTELA